MRFWPSSKQKTEKRDISTDQWASYFNFDGSVYPTNAFGASSGLSAFGSHPSSASTGKTEEPLTDYLSYVNGAYKASGAVFACCQARSTLFTEARFTVQEITDNGPGDFVPGDLSLLQNPWPNGVTASLLSRAIQDVDLAGNFFVLREGVPGNERLRRLRPDYVMILMDGDPQTEAYTDIVAYVYKPNGCSEVDKWEIFPVDGSNGLVAHWAPLSDPESQFRGMSWLTPIIREISTDKAINQHKLRYFQNGAKPGMVVSYDASVTPQQSAEFTEKFNQTKLGVDNAYRPLFLGGGATVTTFGGNIENFKDISSVGETRIAAAARVPAILAGFSESLKGSSLNASNFTAAKDLFADSTIRPLWASLCAVLEPLVDLPEGTRLWYSDKEIAFLREDFQLVAARKQTDSATLSSLLQSGFTPESAVDALMNNDWGLLKHSGMFSVQLQAPGTDPTAGSKNSSPKPPPDVAGK